MTPILQSLACPRNPLAISIDLWKSFLLAVMMYFRFPLSLRNLEDWLRQQRTATSCIPVDLHSQSAPGGFPIAKSCHAGLSITYLLKR